MPAYDATATAFESMAEVSIIGEAAMIGNVLAVPFRALTTILSGNTSALGNASPQEIQEFLSDRQDLANSTKGHLEVVRENFNMEEYREVILLGRTMGLTQDVQDIETWFALGTKAEELLKEVAHALCIPNP